jgi:O-acetyl-ADP-ribose deacetylase (regulator of RNase III)
VSQVVGRRTPREQRGRRFLARLRLLRRYRARNLRLAEEHAERTASRHKEQVQVCPRGCYFERARPTHVVVTVGFGRADVRVDPTFQSRRCPHCGVRLVRKCRRCKGPILLQERGTRELDDPDRRRADRRCRKCGFPFPWAPERARSAQLDVPGWDKRGGYATCLSDRPRHGDLWVVQDEVGDVPFDAIVSCDDEDGRMWTGAAAEIKLRAGDEVERMPDEVVRRLGSAWVTDGGALVADKIVHVAAMDRNGRAPLDLVSSSVAAALSRARRETGVGSIGIPVIGWGAGELDLVEWGVTMARAAIDFLDETREPCPPLLSVVLIIDDEDDRENEITEIRKALVSG